MGVGAATDKRNLGADMRTVLGIKVVLYSLLVKFPPSPVFLKCETGLDRA